MSEVGDAKEGKTAVWKGLGPDGIKRTCIIHAKHKGNVGSSLVQKIATKELGFTSVEEMYRFLNGE
ncbi:hypothetical protein [Pelotomaculum sp. FP]|uniref:hypothetical protein n=1 Tax=Pelotomaculum sp. FP TaxID=261474 RepID=UPI001FAAC632|nr:hypothetical protein [Pelotomaculum sp. FP]